MHNILKSMIAACGVALASGCATGGLLDANEGAVDYRYRQPGSAQYDMKYFPTRRTDAHATPAAAGALTEASAPISKGDYIRVNLKSLFVAEFPESKFFALLQGEYNAKNLEIDAHGEIVVVANVTEGAREVSTNATREQIAGHVVFFSRDFRERQVSNESFVPVAGPMKWDGGDLTMEINVLEIDDAERTRADSMLKTLTSLSTQTNLLNPSALGVLNALGAAVVEGTSRDAIILHHRSVFLPESAYTANVASPILREGDIVFVRKEKRDQTVDWSDLKYMSSTGLLYVCRTRPSTDPGEAAKDGVNREITDAAQVREAQCGDKTPFAWRQDTYLVLTVSRTAPTPSVAPQAALAAFVTAYNGQVRGAATSTAAALQNAANFAVRREAYVHLKRDEETLRNVTNALATRRMAAQNLVTALQCNVYWRTAQLSPAGWVDDTNPAGVFGYCGGASFKTERLLEEVELNNLLAALASLTLSDDLRKKIEDPTVFAATTVDGGKRKAALEALRKSIMDAVTTASPPAPPT